MTRGDSPARRHLELDVARATRILEHSPQGILAQTKPRTRLVTVFAGATAIASFFSCAREQPDFDTSLGRIIQDARDVNCSGDTCHWRDSNWVARTVKPAMTRLTSLAFERFDCAYGVIGYASNDSDQGSHMVGFDCGTERNQVSYSASRLATRYCATTSDRSELQASSPTGRASTDVLWYYFERHDGPLLWKRNQGNALRVCPESCGPDTTSLQLDSSAGPQGILAETVSHNVLMRQCARPTNEEFSRYWNELLPNGKSTIDGASVFTWEGFLSLTPFETTLNRVHICSLVTNPKDGMPDFHDSLWSGSTIEPIVKRLKSVYPKGSARLHLRVSPSIPFMTMRAVFRSIVFSGFDTIALSISDSGPEYPILVHDLVFTEHDPPLPMRIYEEMKEVEVGIDTVWTHTTGLVEEYSNGSYRHVGITRSYPAGWMTNPARSNEILSVLLDTPPVTKKLIFRPAPLTQASAILAMREKVGKIDSILPVIIPSSY